MVFKNRHGEIRSGWAIALGVIGMYSIQVVIGMAVGVIVAVTTMTGGALDLDAYTQQVMAVSTMPVVVYSMYTLMTGALLLTFWLIYKRPLAQMGFHKNGWLPQLMFGCLFGIVSIALATAVLVLSGAAEISAPDWNGLAAFSFWDGLIKFIFVGFFEEILSRGFMMTALKTTRRKWLIVLAPAVVFGLLHLGNPNVTLFSVVNIAAVGLLFAYLFIRTGRLWAPIGFHITWNFFQGNVFGIPVSGTENFSIMNTVFTGPEWLTGGAFGVEGGAVCTLVILLGLAYIHFFVKKPEHELWSMDSHMPLTRGTAPAVVADQDDNTPSFDM